ncbi:MAG: RND family transporter [Aestuariibacter sp.]
MKVFNRLVVANPLWILMVFALACAVSAYFATHFKIDASASTLLLKNNKNYIQSQIVSSRFNPAEFILVAYQPSDNKELFSEQTFSDLEALSSAFTELPRVTATTSILNVPLLSQIEALSPDLEPQDWTWQAKRYRPEKMAKIFADHPLFTDLLVNSEQSATAIQILFRSNEELATLKNKILDIQKNALHRELTDPENRKIEEFRAQADVITQQLNQQRQQELESIKQIIAPYEENASFYVGGSHVLGQQLIDIISQDLKVFGSVITAAIVVVLFLLFRQIRWVLLPVTCCAVSVLLAMGIFGYLDIRTTVISANFIALQLILTLAIVIHLSVEYLQLKEAIPNQDHLKLVTQTIANKFKPCLFAGITTSVGFGSLIFSGIQPVASFGWMMIVAMGISILVSLLLFPAILALFNQAKRPATHRLANSMLSGFYRFSMAAPLLVVALGCGLFLLAVVGFMRLDVENSFINYFDKSTAVHQELSYIDKEFGGSTPLDVVYSVQTTHSEDVVLPAQDIQNLQIIQTVMQQYAAMGNTSSVVNFTQLAKQINDGKPLTEYELSALYMMLDESLKDNLLQSYFSAEHGQMRISARIQDTTPGFQRTTFIQSLQQDIVAQGIEEEQFFITNLFVLYQDILQRLYQSQILTLGLVFAVLTVVLVVIFKSVPVALIAMIPNIITTVGVLGIMGWLAIPLDIMTITIAAIAMGIAVDDTIHFVHRYLAASQNSDEKNPMFATYQSVGFALFCTTSVITVGFSLLSFSDFIPTVLFGLLTAFAMLVAFVTDLTLLPVLLDKFANKRRS